VTQPAMLWYRWRIGINGPWGNWHTGACGIWPTPEFRIDEKTSYSPPNHLCYRCLRARIRP